MKNRNISLDEFRKAAQTGNLDVIEQYIKENNDNIAAINAADSYGDTALLSAAMYGQIDVVNRLLALPGIDINAVDYLGCSALIWAAAFEHFAVVKALIAAPGINVNIESKNGRSALYYAALQGNIAIAEVLLGIPNLNLTARINDQRTIAEEAQRCGHWKVTLLINRAILARTKATALPFRRARATAPPKVSTERFLQAVRNNELAIVENYIAENKNNVAAINVINEAGETALICATNNGHSAIVNALLTVPGINVNHTDRTGHTALIYAAYHGYKAIATTLLAVPGINVNASDTRGINAMMCAAWNGHIDIINALHHFLDIDINAIATGVESYTALMLAAKNGHVAAVRQLICLYGKELNINMINQSGFMAIDLAKQYGHTEIASILSAESSERSKEKINTTVSRPTSPIGIFYLPLIPYATGYMKEQDINDEPSSNSYLRQTR